MRVFIIGNKGNMGRRYAAILRHLGHEAVGCDAGEIPNLELCDAVIVATPTDTHLTLLDFLKECKRPVLCEKPFINEPEAMPYLEHFLKDAERCAMRVSMVSQYDYMLSPSLRSSLPNLTGLTSYDYFRTGNDGLAWDCINIIWWASGQIQLNNQSPLWKCRINGLRLDQANVDYSYVEMIQEWLRNPYIPQYERILKSHQKVVNFLNGLKWKI